MKGMVFAAGLGTRLKPWTLSHPKALVEIGGQTMLQRVISAMKAVGIEEIVINVHHFAAQIINYLNDNNKFGLNIHISDESHMLLDTGGGVGYAAEFLSGSEPVMLYNADILTDADLSAMIESHMADKHDVTLFTGHRESSRQLYFNYDNKLAGWENLKSGETRPDGFIPSPQMTRLALGGIHIISQNIVEALHKQYEKSPVFSIIPFYLDHIKEFGIFSWMPKGRYSWFDVGKPETLEQARVFMNRNSDYIS